MLARYSTPALLGLLLIFSIHQGLRSASQPPVTSTATPPADRPFRLPFDTPPGPGTWYVSQMYGNTQAAYRNRHVWYQFGQGLHFGIDFAAKCGTPVVAIGYGQITEIDNLRHGAGPHNLTILHANGYNSFYGHLLETPNFELYDGVTSGQVVALTGDPDLNCRSRPHLHLEIRDSSLSYAYNPTLFINADWDRLALFGEEYERDLDNPRQWVSPYDQPAVNFGKELYNEYEHAWPPDW